MIQSIFKKDLEHNKMFVTREFAAPIEKVWQAWTDSEILDQWWAPKPWKAKTKIMDFREGGYWLYSMIGPDGTESWCKAFIKKIELLKSFDGEDCFCDENGVKNDALPAMLWDNQFSSSEIGTKVSIEITFESKEALLKIIEMGFEQGFTMAHENLDEILAK